MNKIMDVATLIGIVAGIGVMVRPGSQGPALVNSITNGFVNSIKAATSFSN